MLTIFALPKPFVGHIGMIQRNALASWTQLSPPCQVILFGDETGVAEAAQDFGAQHVKTVECNEYGTPLLSSVFSQARQLSQHRFLCYANADIILFNDILLALKRVSEWRSRFLMVGECWNLDVSSPLYEAGKDWENPLRQKVWQEGRRRGRAALDFFVFSKDCYHRWLPLALGRGGFDNWLLWEARASGAAVVDVSAVVTAVHQNHTYAHLPGGFAEAHKGLEAKRNCELAGGMRRMFTLDDATYLLNAQKVRPRYSRFFRLAHRWSRLQYRLGSREGRR
jgi:hypothetical protein